MGLTLHCRLKQYRSKLLTSCNARFSTSMYMKAYNNGGKLLYISEEIDKLLILDLRIAAQL